MTQLQEKATKSLRKEFQIISYERMIIHPIIIYYILLLLTNNTIIKLIA